MLKSSFFATHFRAFPSSASTRGGAAPRPRIQKPEEGNPNPKEGKSKPLGRKSKADGRESKIKPPIFLRRIQLFQGLTPTPVASGFARADHSGPRSFASRVVRRLLGLRLGNSPPICLDKVKGWRRFRRGRVGAISVRLGGRGNLKSAKGTPAPRSESPRTQE
jgi:hypothetical protein